MIYSIFGKLESTHEDFAVVSVGGLSFKVNVSAVTARSLPKNGLDVKLLTHLHVREDVLALYGFANESELGLFELLTSVSGIGPKSALSVMSLAPVERLKAAIASGESDLLQKSSGIGRKTSERIILELRDKISPGGHHETIKLMESDNDVYEALTGLGYTGTQAKNALSKIDPKITEVKERLRGALKILKNEKRAS
ncbi:MAG: Holliday junction DNA helicase RuvA [Candidatus Colwellbacteria bacterium RIFCSPLOWO2_01_FULL_48_10]|uniref:Holliday junction branch migration complex subunit RuvA n=2 Tax=Bacteria candidate phyla TaxID=1783234 RepID=A0A1F5P0M7_9BACT|nr:MAG: Holliday junction DNA helicase RuvA [Candidatus Doudnabacteria bacterium RIFCSPHIGHO2_01_FULL_49_9]OGY60156.1 MAG: Holliday junction DNA helicase RuvA [Candidatus Colwellbacteria bacterium RIFCSPLOWO2_01_FULL_48_10]